MNNATVCRLNAFVLVLALSVSARGQAYPNVPANLEQQPMASGHRASPQAGSPLQSVPEDFAGVHLSSGFAVQMDIFDIPEMSTLLRVDERGDLIIPLIGRVHVQGLSVGDAQIAVEKAYSDARILKSPQVTLLITQYAASNASVLGEVQQPGRVPLLAPKTLADLLSLVGGETAAAGNEIDITPANGDTPRQVQFSQGEDPGLLRKEVIQPGDSVFVRRADTVYVLGAVNRPGGYLMVHGGRLNVLEAIALAFGTTNVAEMKQMRIVRPDHNGGYVEISVPFNDMTRGDAPPAPLQPNDILYVPTNGFKNFFINGSAILSTAASAAIYKF